jgi:tRNA 2-selenouridine synthase
MKFSEEFPVFDVRSPKEYNKGHIPNAINLPLFLDEERADVGIIYNKKGREQAVIRGLDIVGGKLPGYIEKARQITDQKEILLYCWRGGMRSSALAWLFETAGFTANTLSGGYKAYRNFILEEFLKPVKIIIIGGMTGSGKTSILEKLAEKGEQVLNLEALASHKGSAFGHIGMGEQPSVQQFENNLYDVWRSFDRHKTIWIEDESQSIGHIFIPGPLWLQMQHSPVIVIEMPFESRVEQLVKDYVSIDKNILFESFRKIEHRIGRQNLMKALAALEANDYFTAIEIALKYYDKAYQHSLSSRKCDQVKVLSPVNTSLPKIIESLIILKSIHYS